MTPTGTPLTSSPLRAPARTPSWPTTAANELRRNDEQPTTFTIAKAGVSVTLASPPPSIVYDGTTDVTNWVKATVTGVAAGTGSSGTQH